MGGLEQSAVQDRGAVRRHHRRAQERHGRSQRDGEGDGDRPDLRHHAGPRQRAEGWKVRIAMNKQITGARLLVCTAAILAIIGSSLVAQGGFGQGGRGGGAPAGDPAAAPTPRLANGKPDLTGSWGGGLSFTGAGAPGVTVGG